MGLSEERLRLDLYFSRLNKLMKVMYMKLSVFELKSLLDYDPDTGIFIWKVDRGNNKTKGLQAGSLHVTGYIHISIDNKIYQAHRLAWLYMTGDWPDQHIDHIDRIRNNNKWNNLRKANRQQNAANQKLRKTNKSGYKGVSWDQRSGKYVSVIRVNNKIKHLGYYDDPKEAYCKYLENAKKYFGDYASG